MHDSVRTDQYVYVDHDCPIRTDVHPVDDFVEIIFGDDRGVTGSSLRLVVDDPDMLLRLAKTFEEARARFMEHLQQADLQPSRDVQCGHRIFHSHGSVNG